MKHYYLFFVFLTLTLQTTGNVRLPGIFGDNMVLQRNKPIAVWGWANKGEKIAITFNLQTKTTKANAAGKWQLQLNPEAAGGPFILTVKGNNTIIFSNVLVGEVWVCSGQSNMEWSLSLADNAAQEIAAANYPEIRHFTVTKATSSKPQEDIAGGNWNVSSPESAGNFSAVAYFYARELYRNLKVPIGLINNAWGGTHIETWTSYKAFQANDEFRDMIAPFPMINVDSINKALKKNVSVSAKVWENELANKNVLQNWYKPELNESDWHKMALPGLWESKGLMGLDGIVLFRKTFNMKKADLGKTATLQLGAIDDSDITYLNGKKIGSTDQYDISRSYTIPPGILKEGVNVIAVRVVDSGGGGGFQGDADEMKLGMENYSIKLDGEWSYKIESVKVDLTNTGVGANDYPTLLFNAMLHPLIPFTIQGVIWYQGESNTQRAWQYNKAFPLLISDWRQQWKQGDFPFYFVQLSSYSAGGLNSPNEWAELREAQSNTLLLPNTGMAVTTDVGKSNDIHPRNKKDVGYRLAAIALKNTYQKEMVSEGPTYQSMRVEANRMFISFSKIGSGLVAKDKYGYLKGFEIAGSDQKFYWAKALIDGNNVIVFSDQVTNPVSVRYSWTDDAGESNLFNKDGFPAPPFRTDNWPRSTIDVKYNFK